jgi:N-acetylglucosamine repressor
MKTSFKRMQELNQYRIFDMIRRFGPISRSDLAKKLNLSPTTVATAVSEFIKEGLAVDGEAGDSSGGRKPILVSFVPESKFLIGVSITNSFITIANLDLEAKLSNKSNFSLNIHEQRDVVGYIVSCIASYVKGITDMTRCVGISIITPGIVDALNGVILKNSKLRLDNIPLKSLVEKETGLKTWVDNDANAIALAEKQFGSFQHKNNLIYIQLGEGLGAGMIINNAIFRGRNGGAGEFGHISIDRNGPVCDCGNRGCLDYYVGWPAIYAKILTSLTRGKPSIMLDMAEGNMGNIDLPIFLKALASDDEMAKSVVQEISSYLSTGLVTLTHLFNPDVILIGWDAIYQDHSLIEAIQREVKEQAFTLFTEDLEIQSTTLGKDFQLKGAAAVLLQDLFNFTIQ